MHTLEVGVISLLAGAAATTTAEYFFKYNLLDLLVEKVKGLFSRGEAAVKSKL